MASFAQINMACLEGEEDEDNRPPKREAARGSKDPAKARISSEIALFLAGFGAEEVRQRRRMKEEKKKTLNPMSHCN